MKNTKAGAASRVDYIVLTNAIANAALSRRAALQLELAVGLVHFDQEDNGTESAGKARLKEVYQSAGYSCMAKADRDYKTVNRRLNACAALYDKLGSALVSGWVQSCAGDTEALLAYVVTELQPYGLETMDDVLSYVGKDSSKSRAPRQNQGPKNETAANDETSGESSAESAPVSGAELLAQMKATILAKFGAEEINLFCADLLETVAKLEAATEKKAA